MLTLRLSVLFGAFLAAVYSSADEAHPGARMRLPDYLYNRLEAGVHRIEAERRAKHLEEQEELRQKRQVYPNPKDDQKKDGEKFAAGPSGHDPKKDPKKDEATKDEKKKPNKLLAIASEMANQFALRFLPGHKPLHAKNPSPKKPQSDDSFGLARIDDSKPIDQVVADLPEADRTVPDDDRRLDDPPKPVHEVEVKIVKGQVKDDEDDDEHVRVETIGKVENFDVLAVEERVVGAKDDDANKDRDRPEVSLRVAERIGTGGGRVNMFTVGTFVTKVFVISPEILRRQFSPAMDLASRVVVLMGHPFACRLRREINDTEFTDRETAGYVSDYVRSLKEEEPEESVYEGAMLRAVIYRRMGRTLLREFGTMLSAFLGRMSREDGQRLVGSVKKALSEDTVAQPFDGARSTAEELVLHALTEDWSALRRHLERALLTADAELIAVWADETRVLDAVAARAEAVDRLAELVDGLVRQEMKQMMDVAVRLKMRVEDRKDLSARYKKMRIQFFKRLKGPTRSRLLTLMAGCECRHVKEMAEEVRKAEVAMVLKREAKAEAAGQQQQKGQRRDGEAPEEAASKLGKKVQSIVANQMAAAVGVQGLEKGKRVDADTLRPVRGANDEKKGSLFEKINHFYGVDQQKKESEPRVGHGGGAAHRAAREAGKEAEEEKAKKSEKAAMAGWVRLAQMMKESAVKAFAQKAKAEEQQADISGPAIRKPRGVNANSPLIGHWKDEEEDLAAHERKAKMAKAARPAWRQGNMRARKVRVVKPIGSLKDQEESRESIHDGVRVKVKIMRKKSMDARAGNVAAAIKGRREARREVEAGDVGVLGLRKLGVKADPHVKDQRGGAREEGELKVSDVIGSVIAKAKGAKEGKGVAVPSDLGMEQLSFALGMGGKGGKGGHGEKWDEGVALPFDMGQRNNRFFGGRDGHIGERGHSNNVGGIDGPEREEDRERVVKEHVAMKAMKVKRSQKENRHLPLALEMGAQKKAMSDNKAVADETVDHAPAVLEQGKVREDAKKDIAKGKMKGWREDKWGVNGRRWRFVEEKKKKEKNKKEEEARPDFGRVFAAAARN